MRQLRSLTSLRFIAAAIVVVNHLPAFGPLCPNFLGQAGVSFFFILSGFILTYVHHGDFSNRVAAPNVQEFWRARFARIYPLHFAIAVPLSVIALMKLGPGFITTVIATLLLVQSWNPTSFNAMINNPAWSLSCEIFFYALFPILAWAVMRIRDDFVVFVCAIVVAIIPSAVGRITYHVGATFIWEMQYFPIMRLGEFLCGIFLGRLYLGQRIEIHRVTASILELLAIGTFISAAWLSQPNNFSMMYEVVLSGAAVIFLFGLQRGVLSRTLCLPVFVYLGEISFAIYLVHWTIVTAPHMSPIYGIGLTLIASILMHEVIEKPAQRWLRGHNKLLMRSNGG